MALDPVETLQQLIRISSINPMGRAPLGSPIGEAELTDFLQALCEQFGWPWLRQRVHDGRENLVMMVVGSPPPIDGGELLFWDVHQDTVAVAGMSVDPFGGQLNEGRVYGRGACDDKGPMAAMIAALSRLAPDRQSRSPRPTVVIAFTVNEEYGFSGATALGDLWNAQRQAKTEIVGGTISPAELFPRAPDAAIVAEPTDFNVVVAHRGMVRWRCHASGKAGHSSQPDLGINAIYGMTHVVRAIEAYHGQLTSEAPEHPLCGRPSVCVTTIRGGAGINTIPDRATIEIDRRISPGDDPDIAYNDLVAHIDKSCLRKSIDVNHDSPFMQSRGLSNTSNRSIAARLAEIVRERGQPGELVGAPYGTNAAAISATGVPTVVFGPGSIRQAHTADEFIDVEALRLGVDIYQAIAEYGLRS